MNNVKKETIKEKVSIKNIGLSWGSKKCIKFRKATKFI